MRIAACGEVIFSSRNLRARLDENVREILSNADGAFVNAEINFPDRDTFPAAKRYFVESVSDAALDELSSIGLNLFSAANNHAGDFGPCGMMDTLRAYEERKLLCAGLGRSLDEARAPKFLDTPHGRIGLIAATSTNAAEWAASHPGKGIAARPGVNPLRWGRAYVLPDEEFRTMQRINELLGTAQSYEEMRRIEVQPPLSEDIFFFGSLLEDSIQIERGEKADVRYFANQSDVAALLESVKDAANRADIVIVSLHCHEGTRDNWYSPEPASFIREFALQAIDAGASAFFGHGPHMLRGVEFHRERPIFYSLGSLLFEFEMGEQRILPEVYENFGFSQNGNPSKLHLSRARDAQGRPSGFYADPRFSRSCIAICDFESQGTKVNLVPLDLDLNRSRAVERGLPVRATGALAEEICNGIAQMSRRYGTKATYDKANMTLSVGPD